MPCAIISYEGYDQPCTVRAIYQDYAIAKHDIELIRLGASLLKDCEIHFEIRAVKHSVNIGDIIS